MFYRIVIVKENLCARSMTLKAKSKEEVEKRISEIKAFLYPNEDTSGYVHIIKTNEVEAYAPGTKVPEYQITVYKPEESEEIDINDPEYFDLILEDSEWYEDIIEADSAEEAREKFLSKECLYSNVGYDKCCIYINEVPVSMLLEEVKRSISNYIEHIYINKKHSEMTVREFNNLHRNIWKNEKMQYEAHKYMRSALSIADCLNRGDFDLEKMSAKEYIELLTQLPLLNEDRDAWNKMFEEAKRTYGKPSN